MKTVSCGEAGLCCQRRTEEVIKNGAEHAVKVHGMKEEDLTPEMKQKIKVLIRSS